MNTKRPNPADVAANWRLDPDTVFLNHGSFGACPASVIAAQQSHRDRMEREPVRFFSHDIFGLLDRSRRAISSLIGGQPENYVFTPNATQAVAAIMNNVARGIGLAGNTPLGPGDEILINTHEYPACQNIVRRVAGRVGATVICAVMPWLDQTKPANADTLYDIIMGGVTDRTRLCMFSLITSPTAMVLPAKRLIADLHAKGITTLLDAAHGPGALELDVADLGATFTTSNCHKWLCAPKGAAILHVQPAHQEGFRPLVLSNFANAPEGTMDRSKFNLEFDYVGTDDPTARLTIADACELVPIAAERSWSEIIAHNNDLVKRGRDVLLAKLGTQNPVADECIGPIATVPLPDIPAGKYEAVMNRPTIYANALQDALVERHGVQVPVWVPSLYMREPFDGKRFIRLSAQVYNSIEQYEYLAEVLVEELEREAKL